MCRIYVGSLIRRNCVSSSATNASTLSPERLFVAKSEPGANRAGDLGDLVPQARDLLQPSVYNASVRAAESCGERHARIDLMGSLHDV
jgi:hypothetical protein